MPDSEIDITSTFQRFCSAKRVYMRKISAAKSEASSPPVPARISRMTFFSSLGSLGSSNTLSSSSSACPRGSSAAISSCAMARRSASLSASMARASARPWRTCFSSRYFSTGVSISRRAFAIFEVFFVVVQHFGQSKLRLHLVVALLHLFQAVNHFAPHWREDLLRAAGQFSLC